MTMSESVSEKERTRAQADKEANEDLQKSIKHLLIDVHHELLRQNRTPLENIMHAQKRLASLTVKNAIENEKLTKENIKLQNSVTKLTGRIHNYTIILMMIGVISISPFIIKFFKWFVKNVCN